MKAFSAGLLLGLALGAGMMWLAEPSDSPPPVPPPEESAESAAANQHLPPEEGEAPDREEPPASKGGEAGRSGASETDRPEDWPDEKILEAVAALARGDIPQDRSLTHHSGRLAIVYWARCLTVSHAVIESLLSREEMDLRWLGCRLVRRDSQVSSTLLKALATAREYSVRIAALDAWGRLVPRDPAHWSAVDAAVRDPVRAVRLNALSWLSVYGKAGHPGASALLVALTRDPDREVRYKAIRRLASAGSVGSSRAAEMIRSGSYDSESLRDLVEVALEAARAPELLDRDPTPEIVGREQPNHVRTAALLAGLDEGRATREALAGAREVLRSREDSARFRATIVEQLGEHFRAKEGRAELEALLTQATRDESLWVRDAATEALERIRE